MASRGEVELCLAFWLRIGEQDNVVPARLVLPAVSHVADQIEREIRNWPVPVTILRGPREKYDAFAASEVALEEGVDAELYDETIDLRRIARGNQSPRATEDGRRGSSRARR